MQRRDFFKTTLAFLGSGLTSVQVGQVWARVETTSRLEEERFNFIALKDVEFFKLFIETLVPTKDLLGSNLDLARFVDEAVVQTKNEIEKQTLELNLLLLKRSCNIGLKAQEEGNLAVLIANALTSSNLSFAHSINTFRELAMVGFYTSEYVSKKLLNFNPIPGKYKPHLEVTTMEKQATWSR